MKDIFPFAKSDEFGNFDVAIFESGDFSEEEMAEVDKIAKEFAQKESEEAKFIRTHTLEDYLEKKKAELIPAYKIFYSANVSRMSLEEYVKMRWESEARKLTRHYNYIKSLSEEEIIKLIHIDNFRKKKQVLVSAHAGDKRVEYADAKQLTEAVTNVEMMKESDMSFVKHVRNELREALSKVEGKPELICAGSMFSILAVGEFVMPGTMLAGAGVLGFGLGMAGAIWGAQNVFQFLKARIKHDSDVEFLKQVGIYDDVVHSGNDFNTLKR